MKTITTLTNEQKLKRIADNFRNLNYNEYNYEIGGGLDVSKFASNRHEDALNDAGKRTMGKAVQMFKRATGLETSYLKDLIFYTFKEEIEWHHAGLLPKTYGGGMKKTYFLNSKQITELAENFNKYKSEFDTEIENNKKRIENERNIEKQKEEFLKVYAKYVSRKNANLFNSNDLFYETDREMQGKYGWFSSYGKSYNLDEYVSGWLFYKEEDYRRFLKDDFEIKEDDLKEIYVKVSKDYYFKTIQAKWNGKGKPVTKATYLKNIKRIENERIERENFLKTYHNAIDLTNDFFKLLAEKQRKEELQRRIEANKYIADFYEFFKNEVHPAPAHIVQMKAESGLSWNALRDIYK